MSLPALQGLCHFSPPFLTESLWSSTQVHCDLPLPGSLCSKRPPRPCLIGPCVIYSLRPRGGIFVLKSVLHECFPASLTVSSDISVAFYAVNHWFISTVLVQNGSRRSERSLTSLFRHSPKCIQSSSQMNQSANSPKRVLRNLEMQIKAQINQVTRNYF